MLKAFLEVICTLGSLVFVSVLPIRGIWIGVAYVQVNQNHKVGNFEDESRPWTGAQPDTYTRRILQFIILHRNKSIHKKDCWAIKDDEKITLVTDSA